MRTAKSIGDTKTESDASNNNRDLILGKTRDTLKHCDQDIVKLLNQSQLHLEAIREFINHTATAVQALTKNKRVKTGIILTEGVRKILKTACDIQPELFNTQLQQSIPLIQRHLRREVSEHINYEGKILNGLDFDEVEDIIRNFKTEGVEAIVISFLHSYQNNDHERATKYYINKYHPEFTVTYSTESIEHLHTT